MDTIEENMEVTISTNSRTWSAIGRFPWTKALLGIAVLAAVVILGRQAAALIPQFAAKIDSLGGRSGRWKTMRIVRAAAMSA